MSCAIERNRAVTTGVWACSANAMVEVLGERGAAE